MVAHNTRLWMSLTLNLLIYYILQYNLKCFNFRNDRILTFVPKLGISNFITPFTNIAAVLSTLQNFVRMFNKAHQENCEQTEQEMKKLAAESQKS